MTELVVRPYQGVGPVDFGMTPEQVAAVLGPPSTAMKRGPEWDLQWYFDELELCVTFDNDLRCNFVDFLGPAGVGVVHGVRLTGRYADIVGRLGALGFGSRDLPSFTFPEMWSGDTVFDDLGVIVGRNGEDDEDICGAGAYRRGLWEEARRAAEEKLRRERESEEGR